MIGYVTLGSNDIDQAAIFYDQLLKQLGAGRFMESDTFIAWAVSPDQTALSIIKPADSNAASVGNGVMVAVVLQNPQQVDALYHKAIELAGSDEGPTGPRGAGFYAGYFRDPDGNKLNAFCQT